MNDFFRLIQNASNAVSRNSAIPRTGRTSPAGFSRRVATLPVTVWLLTVLLSGISPGDDIQGHLEWPTKWKVFAPMGDKAPELPAGVLQQLPEKLQTAEGQEILPRDLEAEPGSRMDLKGLFPEPKIGNTAWLFADIQSDRDQTATLGMGADWWFTAYVNGVEVLATPRQGNMKWPPNVTDYTAPVPLRKGSNILAVLFRSGAASAYFTAGGPAEIRAAQKPVTGKSNPLRFNSAIGFSEKLPFPFEDQAIATVSRELTFPDPPEGFRKGLIAGLEKLPRRQLHLTEMYGRPWVLDNEDGRDQSEPVEILLSKRKFPAEDLHMDVVVWTAPQKGGLPEGELEVLLKDSGGKVLSRQKIAEFSETGWFFSIGLPDVLDGKSGELEIIWSLDGREVGRAAEHFEVLPPGKVVHSGTIGLEVINGPGAVLPNAPMTVGLPFPHGALFDQRCVRLVDEQGTEIPLQTRITGRWSRFGAIQWLLCDFTVDLDGKPRRLKFEFGDKVFRTMLAAIPVSGSDTGFPTVDAGRIRTGSSGLAYSSGPTSKGLDASPVAKAANSAQPVLSAKALRGAFVQKEGGKRFLVPENAAYAIEEQGSEKAVVRTAGWYLEEGGREAFCNYVTRFVFHRNSPVARIYHTWIFTGDGNEDRIREMGWNFDSAGTFVPKGFLEKFGSRQWLSALRLVQFDHSRFELDGDGTDRNGRTPGVLAGEVSETGVVFGAKNFWENFPSELEFQGNGFTFFNWPRHNRPRYTPSPVPAGKAFQLRYAHEGELLGLVEGETIEAGKHKFVINYRLGGQNVIGLSVP